MCVQVSISIKYATQLAYVDNRLRFFLPTCIVPRYSGGRTARSALTQPSGNSRSVAAYTLQVRVQLQMVSSIESVTASLPVKVTIPPASNKTTASVTLKNRVGLDRDLELMIALKDIHTPTMLTEFHPEKDSYAVLLSFLPHIETTILNTEIILVVDRSGSMWGDRIIQARHHAIMPPPSRCPVSCTLIWLTVCVYLRG